MISHVFSEKVLKGSKCLPTHYILTGSSVFIILYLQEIRNYWKLSTKVKTLISRRIEYVFDIFSPFYRAYVNRSRRMRHRTISDIA